MAQLRITLKQRDVRIAMQKARRATLQTLAKEIKATIREKVNIKVGIRKGPRGGKIIIRSKPGEYPRRETGTFRKGIRVVSQGPIQAIDIISRAPYGGYLDRGTPKMAARPWGARTIEDDKEGYTERITQLMHAHFEAEIKRLPFISRSQ